MFRASEKWSGNVNSASQTPEVRFEPCESRTMADRALTCANANVLRANSLRSAAMAGTDRSEGCGRLSAGRLFRVDSDRGKCRGTHPFVYKTYAKLSWCSHTHWIRDAIPRCYARVVLVGLFSDCRRDHRRLELYGNAS
jgi:hypothetical protein